MLSNNQRQSHSIPSLQSNSLQSGALDSLLFLQRLKEFPRSQSGGSFFVLVNDGTAFNNVVHGNLTWKLVYSSFRFELETYQSPLMAMLQCPVEISRIVLFIRINKHHIKVLNSLLVQLL
jgi:hypothetical protein